MAHILYECLVLCFSLSLLVRYRFFQILVLLEVSLLMLIYGIIKVGGPLFVVLLVFALGACESALGLSVSVTISRAVGTSSFSV